MDFSDLKYPILQAPIGTLASVDVAAAVSNAGGMGSLALTWVAPDDAADRVRALRERTRNPFFVNFVLSFPSGALDAALDAGAPVVSFSWGQPNEALVRKVKQSGAGVGVQIGTVEGARRAIGNGADFIICQGQEAGGHVQSTTQLDSLLADVREVAGSTPIVAAGGLVDGTDLQRVRTLGATAAMMGTRFVATIESDAHRDYKQALVDSRQGDSVYTLCFDGGWPYAAHRVLRNATHDEWEASGCPPGDQRPGDNETVARHADGTDLKRYSGDEPLSTTTGDILNCCLYAGAGCGKVTDIPAIADLLPRIWAEYQAEARLTVSSNSQHEALERG